MIAETIAEPRALEILDRVKAAFAAKGFDGASMQDLARAAGMSAGNFYRYFPSKNAIVEAIIGRELDMICGTFAEVIRAPDPLRAFRGMVADRLEALDGCDGQIWLEIEASATRRPEIAALVSQLEAGITRALVEVFARIADIGPEEAGRRFSAHARLIVMLVQGVSQRCASAASDPRGPHDRELAALVVRTIENTLAEVTATIAPPASEMERS